MGVVLMRGDAPLRDPNASPTTDDQAAQLRGIVQALARRRGLIASVGIIVFSVVLAGVMMSPKRYEANALIMVNPTREQVLSQEQTFDNSAPNSSVVDSEIELLRSQELMRQLVARLDLDQSPEWNASLRPPGPIDSVTRALTATIRGEAAGDARSVEDIREAVANEVARNVTVRRRGNSYGIAVTVEAASAASAARVANALGEVYLETQTSARFENAQRANVWLEQQLNDLRAEVQEKEGAAEEFRHANGLSVASAGADTAAPQSADVQTMLVSARADVAEKEARLRQLQEMLRAGGSAETLGGALNSPVISELRAREGELARRQAEMAQRYSSEHPELQSVRIEVEEVRGRIREETARITENLRNEVQVARARLATLQGSFGSATGASDENNEAAIQYRQLMREVAAARAVHENFLQRYHEVSNQGDLPTATSRLVSRAVAPAGPSEPRLNFAFLIALAAALALGTMAALIAEAFDGSMTTAEDVERKVGARTIASIPILKAHDYRGLAPHRKNPVDYLVDKPMSAFAEALRVFRASVMHARLDGKVRVMAITSAIPNEGKTTLSISIARICAMSGQRVVLIDCDLRRQSISQTLEITAQSGLVQVLAGEADWRRVVIQDRETSAHIIPAVSSNFTPRDLFSSNAMAELIGELREVYDLVILDCAPILAIAETRLVITHADAVALVARSQRTHAGAVKTALREVETAGGELLGIALNCVDPKAPGRGAYGDTLYYRYAEKSYYHA
jgi:exopolysaccharide transport family protein